MSGRIDPVKEALSRSVFKCLDESILGKLISVEKFGFKSIRVKSKGRLSRIVTLEGGGKDRIFKVVFQEVKL